MKIFQSFLFMLCMWGCAALSAQAQGPAFTFQGRLSDSAGPANGSYDFGFPLNAKDARITELEKRLAAIDSLLKK